MRHLLLAALAGVALVGCDAYNEAYNSSFRTTFRQASIDSCVETSRRAENGQTRGWDWQRLCTCATDRMMAGKSTEEVAELHRDRAGQQRAREQCVAEVIGATAGGAATPDGNATEENGSVHE